MTEMAAAIIVVSLPALKSLLHRRGEGSTPNYATGSRKTGTASSHVKLSSGRDPYVVATARAASADDSGSEVELNRLEGNVIYKTARVSVTYQTREEMEQGNKQTSPK